MARPKDTVTLPRPAALKDSPSTVSAMRGELGHASTPPSPSAPRHAAAARGSHACWVFIASMVPVIAIYFAEPGWHLVTWTMIGLGGALAVVVGAYRHRPSDSRPWHLLAAAMMTLVGGDTLYNVLTDVFHQSEPFPSIADVSYLLTYPLAAGGIMLMIRRRSPHRDHVALVDALVLASALALLIWVFVVTPTVSDPGVGWTESVVSLAYPLGDVLLIVVTLRLLTGGGGAGWSLRFLIIGVLGLLASDIAYMLIRLYGHWRVGTVADLGWTVFYVSWGAAALHPSMRPLTEPYRRSGVATAGSVIPLALAALVAPTVLFNESFQTRLRDGAVIAVFSAAMFLLVLYRIVIQNRQLRHHDSVTQNRTMLRELRHRAYRDALTGLGNRLRFQERAERALARAQDVGGQACMLLIDLDNFKEVNDTQGHKAGDELLKAAAGRLAAAVRPGDLPVRIGGDEFAVLLADGSTPDGAEALAERLVTTFAAPFRVSGETADVRASIGVATSADAPLARGEDAAEVLFRNADLALYAAKAEGKAMWRRYEPDLYQAALDRMSLRSSLDDALFHEEFVLHYQPIIDVRIPALATRVAGFEALVRWQHPTRGLLMPDEFIPLAEETGQIVPLGRWILSRAITDAARWNRAFTDGVTRRISVNLAAQQFLDRDLVGFIQTELVRAGLAPELLILEITETAFLHHHGIEVNANLIALATLGVGIAIDDFGTGYSSIAYLRDMHIDILKADKSFVDNIAEEENHAVLLAGIVRVATSLDIAVVAEGVETTEQVEMLRRMGCAYAQGFMFAAAVPFEAVGELVEFLEAVHPPDHIHALESRTP